MFKTRLGGFCVLPFDKFTIHSKKSVPELVETLSNETKWVPKGELGLRNFEKSKSFYGEINNDNFVIRKAINYRNSFVPTIIGDIKPSTYNISRTDIEIKMRMGKFVMLFGILWFGIIGGSMFPFFTKPTNIQSDDVMAIVMILFGYLLFTGGFNYEAVKARKALISIFEGEEV